MRRMTKIAAACSLFLISALAPGQETQSAHPSPEEAFTSRELVAWSYLQTPQPAPQPAPPAENALPRPDQQRVSSPEVQLFIGTLRKDAGTYSLQVERSTYPLDGNVEARDADQTVQVVGHRDGNNGIIHVLKIARLP